MRGIELILKKNSCEECSRPHVAPAIVLLVPSNYNLTILILSTLSYSGDKQLDTQTILQHIE